MNIRLHHARYGFNLGRQITIVVFLLISDLLFTITHAATAVSGDYMMLRLANEFNDKKAQYIVGRKYYTGTGVAKNMEEAVKYLNRSAQQNYDKAQYLLGKMNLYGDGVPTNFLNAYDLLSKAANQDHPEAKFELANLLFHDKYGRKDTQRAISLYREAAEDRHIAAQYMLGIIYLEGKSVSANKGKGRKWLKLAADNGETRANEYLATLIEKQRDKQQKLALIKNSKPQDRSSKKSKIEKSPTTVKTLQQVDIVLNDAKSGNVDAQYIVGMKYLTGDRLEQNPLQAIKWLRKAAEQDHAGAQHQLGLLYRDGVGVTKSESEAIKWFRLAASWGISKALKDLESLLHKQLITTENSFAENPELSKPDNQYYLGMMYVNGNGVEKDPSTAAQWLLKAAQQNHPQAQYQLGQMYKSGLGVKENRTEAKTWLTKAADSGLDKASESLRALIQAEEKRLLNKDTKALTSYPDYAKKTNPEFQYNLGLRYLKGKAGVKDVKNAIRYLQLAAEDDHVQAQLKLAELYLNGLNVDKDFFTAAKWFKKAAEQGNPEAQYNLGNLYRKGLGVYKSNSKAVKWYQLAAKQGHLKARNRLGGCRVC